MADTPAQDRALKLPRTQIGGRWVTAYDPLLALRIVEKLSEGKTLKEICTPENGFPHPTTFHKWVARCPELRLAYEAAKMLSAYAMEEEALDTARGVFVSPGTAQKVRSAEILIKQLTWSAAKRNPQQFAERNNTNVVVPVNITTSLDLGGNGPGDNNTKEYPDIYALDVTPIKPDETEIEAAAEELGLKVGEEAPLVPKHDPHAPRKQVLTPVNPDFKLDPNRKR